MWVLRRLAHSKDSSKNNAHFEECRCLIETQGLFPRPPLSSVLKGGYRSRNSKTHFACVCLSQFKIILPFKEEVVLSYLQPGVEYCVTTAVQSQFGSHSLTGPPHCAFTSPAPPSASTSHYLLTVSTSPLWYFLTVVVVTVRLVYILAATCGALGPLLAIVLLYGSQPGVRLLKRQLRRTMVTTSSHIQKFLTFHQSEPSHLSVSLSSQSFACQCGQSGGVPAAASDPSTKTLATQEQGFSRLTHWLTDLLTDWE